MTVKSFGLSVDEREALALVVDTKLQWDAITKNIQALCDEAEHKVLRYSLEQGHQGLAHEKARCEGALRLQSDFITSARAIAKKELERK